MDSVLLKSYMQWLSCAVVHIMAVAISVYNVCSSYCHFLTVFCLCLLNTGMITFLTNIWRQMAQQIMLVTVISSVILVDIIFVLNYKIKESNLDSGDIWSKEEQGF